MKVKLAVAFLVLCLGSIAHADSAGTIYDINGHMTLTGDGSCPSCVETINYSFVLDESTTCPISIAACIVGAVSTSSSGPLGTFSSEDRLLPDHGIYLGFLNGLGDEMDMYLGISGPPTALPSNLFSCNSSACVTDFNVGSEYGFTVANQFTATDPSPTVPESSSLLLSVIGLASLVLARRRSHRFSITPR
jgi:hypothetical protein